MQFNDPWAGVCLSRPWLRLLNTTSSCVISSRRVFSDWQVTTTRGDSLWLKREMASKNRKVGRSVALSRINGRMNSSLLEVKGKSVCLVCGDASAVMKTQTLSVNIEQNMQNWMRWKDKCAWIKLPLAEVWLASKQFYPNREQTRTMWRRLAGNLMPKVNL